ncbi:hypothetical protein M0804_009686 [Polistes exclamans]|nr:hypothetical protein M0804_009686 [Polistes exclamans]
MADFRLSPIMKVLVKNHKKGTSAIDTAVVLLLNKHYRYLEVCAASINYWFRFFTEHPNRFSTESIEFYVSLEERLAFVSVLLKTNPFWTINHFTDALKVCEATVHNYISRCGFDYGPQGWFPRQKSSQ